MKTRIHIFLTIITIIAVSICSHAANRGYIPDFEIVGAGVETEVSFYIQSPVEGFDGFQTEIELPQELSYLPYEHGYTEYVDAYSSGFQIASRVSDNTLKVVGFATDTNKKFNSGAVFKFKIRSSSNIEYKDYTITVKNTRVSKGEDEYTLDNSSTAVTVVSVEPIRVTSITLNTDFVSLKVTETFQLIATILPEDATDKTVIWSSSDIGIATVDETGLITAKSFGMVGITATCGDASASCFVLVENTPAESVQLNRTSATLKATETVQLMATVFPETATDKTITWLSSNESVARVDSNGLVTAVSVGSATITATCGDVSVSCEVTVEPTLANRIKLSQIEMYLQAGESTQLIATVSPVTTTDKTVTWSSSDVNVVTVDGTGLVTAVSAGFAYVTAACGNVSATCEVTVEPKEASSITLNRNSVDLKTRDTFQLIANVLPETTTDKTVMWSSNNIYVATVDETGLVTAISGGVAEITAECGGVCDFCMVFVEPRYVTSITFDITEKVAKVGDEFTITATVLPEDADNKTLGWCLSDNMIATVENGNVKVYGEGDCSIIAFATDGSGVMAECRLTSVSGIEDIVVGDKDARFDIYNLNGVLLHKNAGVEDLRELATGCYIINNRKVYKR